jgi:hypothetical protein
MVNEYLAFDEAALRDRLSSLPANSAASFAFLCAARVSRTARRLQAVAENVQFSLLEAEESLKQALIKGKKLAPDLEKRVLDASFSEEEDESFKGAVIEDACASLAYAIRALGANPIENAAFSARRGYEAVDRYASLFINQDEYSEATENIILKNPAVQRELHRQYRDYKAILDGAPLDEIILNTGNDDLFINMD